MRKYGNFSITYIFHICQKSAPFFSSISEESENDSDEGSGRRGSLAPPSGRFSGGGSGGAAELAGVPGDGHEKENLLPNDQSDSIYLTN